MTKIAVGCAVTWGIQVQQALSEVRNLSIYPVTGGAITYGCGVEL